MLLDLVCLLRCVARRGFLSWAYTCTRGCLGKQFYFRETMAVRS